ncbi:MAG: YCF48-related protein [Pirellulaceae bacterium]|nr:hypothetical protein [Planctomycetales bacterium]
MNANAPRQTQRDRCSWNRCRGRRTAIDRCPAVLACAGYLLVLGIRFVPAIPCGTAFGQDPIQEITWPDAFRRDATLRDIHFTDRQNGWAVGDRGVIWHTIDGGRNWLLQDAVCRHTLHCVHFSDPQHGWIVGALAEQGTGHQRGVVLTTQDGGNSWQRAPTDFIGGLHAVRGWRPRVATVVGGSSSMFPRGVMSTSNEGKSWRGNAGLTSVGWSSADFLGEDHVLLAGYANQIGIVHGNRILAATTPPMDPRRIRDLCFIDGQVSIAAGDGGLLWVSLDGGATWQDNGPAIPTGIAERFDFTCVGHYQNHVWIGMNPGTTMLYSSDRGSTWNVRRTLTSLPVEAITFIDEQQGWAVGPLGTIMATTDGGTSWAVQSQFGSRASVLIVTSRVEDIPWGLLAQYSAVDGHHTRLLVTNASHSNDESGTLQDRLEAAVASTSSSGCDICRGPYSIATLTTRICLAIRQYQPTVIVTCSPSDTDRESQQTFEATLKAVETAGDANEHRDQLMLVGVSPCEVAAVFSQVSGGDPTTSVTVYDNSLSLPIGYSVGELARIGQRCLTLGPEVAPGTTWMVRRVDAAAADWNGRSIFASLGTAIDPAARRTMPEAERQQLTQLRAQAQSRRLLDSLLKQAASGQRDMSTMLSRLDELATGLTAYQRGEVYYLLSRQFQAQGAHDLAAQMLAKLLEDEQHPLNPAAARDVLRSTSSVELKLRTQTPLSTGNDESKVTIGELERTQAALFAEPRMRLARAALFRTNGQWQDADKVYRSLLANDYQPQWHRWASYELSRRNPLRAEQLQMPILRLPHTPRPSLDGRLDDETWQSAVTLDVANHASTQPAPDTSIRCGHDDEFIYISVQCTTAEGCRYDAATEPRQRDTNLASEDRVELYFDTNRDMLSAWRFAVDWRGWGNESCFDDATWNPRWYIAAVRDDESWTCEVAIPLSELTRVNVTDDAWVFGLRRIIPDRGSQSWPAELDLSTEPSYSGILLFE